MNYPNLNNIEKDVFIVFLKILKQINKKKLLTEKNELFLQIQSKLEKNNEFQTVLILFGKFEIYYFICSLQKKIKSEQSKLEENAESKSRYFIKYYEIYCY